MASQVVQPEPRPGPQFATIRIREGKPSPQGEVIVWARFGGVKFFNEDFEDLSILLVAQGAEFESGLILTAPARGSVAFTSIAYAEINYYLFGPSAEIDKVAAGRGGGPIKFEHVHVLLGGTGIKGGNQ